MEPDEKDAVISALQAALESFGKSMNELKKERDEAREELEIARFSDAAHDRLVEELAQAFNWRLRNARTTKN